MAILYNGKPYIQRYKLNIQYFNEVQNICSHYFTQALSKILDAE